MASFGLENQLHNKAGVIIQMYTTLYTQAHVCIYDAHKQTHTQ